LVSYAQLNFPTASSQVVPLVLRAHAIKVGSDFQGAHENIISHVIGQAIAIAFWLVLA
jgi:hypothetical protein